MMDDDRLDVSPFDTDREYDVLTLANGLEVLLVRDAATEEAACCMCVMAGAFLDPYPGVAHLLEHMLFLASVKYPELSAYQDFVSRHSGRTNAFTSSEHTTFYFQIPNASFGEAMDRFAQFFAGPSFVPSAVEREIKAVNRLRPARLMCARSVADHIVASVSTRKTCSPTAGACCS